LIGKTLSHYRIAAALGAGGMGEVYRATDTSLGREVAIKVLPAVVAQDPERLGRFKREAHLLASLNHPNIAAIHGLEEADGQPFLVLELVEGEDLRQRLERGAIPVDEALEIARQVAEALEEAHNKSIIHRDLKPANVKVTPDGKVKVLDFGLAKAWAGDATEGSSPSASMSQSPTLAHTGTAAGVILGTAAYMSPEQARGKSVDKRGDVWAFGVLLWEMLTGQTLFSGDTVTDVIAAVVTKEPDLDALPAKSPKAVRWLLARCLRKDPRTRLPDIGTARLTLQDVLSGTAAEGDGLAAESTEAIRSAIERRGRERVRWAWTIALLSAGVAAFLAFVHLTEVQEPQPRTHFVLDKPDDLAFGDSASPAVSPDGRHVVFLGIPSGSSGRLWIRHFESPEARVLPGTEGADGLPFWSPDGGSVGFVAEGHLKKLTLGGTVQRICPLPQSGFWGGSWNKEGTIIFATGGSTPNLYSVVATGGQAKALPTSHGGVVGRYWPEFLPDGRHFLFSVEASDEAGLHVTSLDAPDEARRVLPEDVRAAYASGHLLFVREGGLMAQPFDTARRELTGEPAPVVENVASWSGWLGYGWFSASPTGVLAYREGSSDVELAWLDRKGERLATVGEPRPYDQIALSPDGRRVAVEIPSAEGWDLWVIDVSRGVASRLTSDPGDERDPVWSPDSQEVIYGSLNGSDHGLFRKGLGDGPAIPVPAERRAEREYREIPEDWSREGSTLLYKTLNGTRLWALPVEDGGEAEMVLDLDFIFDEPQISPDGRWLAYVSQESGAWEVYVAPFRRPGERVRVSLAGGGQPKWRGDGKELFYLSSAGELMAVSVGEGTSGPDVGLPTALFKAGPVNPVQDNYAVSADGQRFLVKVPAQGSTRERIHVVLNWTSLLE
jgi:Tol biopolymer transport system component